jgi:hypothetical protein
MVIYCIKIVKLRFGVIFDVDQNADVRIKIIFRIQIHLNEYLFLISKIESKGKKVTIEDL